MAKLVYGIEGLDRLGKSALIEGIRQRQGYYEVIHFGKPQKLNAYIGALSPFGMIIPATRYPDYVYQRESFINSMLMAKSGARIIFDRWHLGEAVYSPMYRAYSGDYVFALEKALNLQDVGEIRLILLTENFDISRHFESDGNSFDDKKRREEQALFIEAFNKSVIRDKKIICVTAADGSFRPKEEILDEALA